MLGIFLTVVLGTTVGRGWGDPAFDYDEEEELFRWTDGRFPFSREYADFELLG